jgi:hypothetical protein
VTARCSSGVPGFTATVTTGAGEVADGSRVSAAVEIGVCVADVG